MSVCVKTYQITKEADQYHITRDDVCKAMYIVVKGQIVVMQLDTPKEHRGKGYAKEMLDEIRGKSKCPIRVVSTETALGYYHKLNYKQLTPNVFESL